MVKRRSCLQRFDSLLQGKDLLRSAVGSGRHAGGSLFGVHARRQAGCGKTGDHCATHKVFPCKRLWGLDRADHELLADTKRCARRPEESS